MQSNGHHAVVEYGKKLLPGNISSPLCNDHDGKDCIYWCQTCWKATCIDCVISLHNGHSFTKLETALQEKRTSLQNELENLESNILKEWKDLLVQAKQATADFLEQMSYGGIEKKLEDRAKVFHKIVDEILENNKKQLREAKASNLAALREQERRVSDGLEKVKQDIKDCEDRLRTGDIENLLKDVQESKQYVLPTISGVIPPSFTSSQIDSTSLAKMFGKLTVQKASQADDSHHSQSTDTSKSNQKTQFVKRPKSDPATVARRHSDPIQTPLQETLKSSSTESVSVPPIPDKKPTVPGRKPFMPDKKPAVPDRKPLIPGKVPDRKPVTQETAKPSVAGHSKPIQAQTKPLQQQILIPTGQSKLILQTSNSPVRSIACALSGQAWIRVLNRKLQLVDRHASSVKDAIETDFDFGFMIISPQGDILLSDTSNNSIKSISRVKKLMIMRWTVKTLFKLLWTPTDLCCLDSGNIAVTFFNEGCVVIYSTSGQVIKALDTKLFNQPLRVAQNKINSDMYITDRNPIEDLERNRRSTEDSSTGKVLALDKDFNIRYEYTGRYRNRKPFSPYGLCTDEAGHVLISDHNNHRVHILDKDGQFLRELLTEDQRRREPYNIDVDDEGNAWVGYSDGGVIVVKYLQ